MGGYILLTLMIPDEVLDLIEGWWMYTLIPDKVLDLTEGWVDIFCSSAAPGDAEYGREMRNSSKGSFHKIKVG